MHKNAMLTKSIFIKAPSSEFWLLHPRPTSSSGPNQLDRRKPGSSHCRDQMICRPASKTAPPKLPPVIGDQRQVRHMGKTAAAKPNITHAPKNRHPPTASNKNCRRMSRRRAPTANRTPISRVRSVTDTSMMFRMPMPPVRSETSATDARRMDSVLAPASLVTADNEAAVIDVASARASTSPLACAMLSPSRTKTRIAATDRNFA